MRKQTISCNKIVILLTGTINPNTRHNLSLQNPTIRKEQYFKAINYYLKKTDFRIVFVENSGAEFDFFLDYKERFEYVSFKDNPDENDRGKGWKEYGILDFAFKNSIFIKESSFIYKITGRLIVLNINRLVNLKSIENSKNIIFANYFKNGKMDSRCFFMSKNFIKYFIVFAIKIDTKYSFEKALFDSIKLFKSSSKNNKFKQLKLPLKVDGMSATSGKSYNVSKTIYYTKVLRHNLKKLIIRLKIRF